MHFTKIKSALILLLLYNLFNTVSEAKYFYRKTFSLDSAYFIQPSIRSISHFDLELLGLGSTLWDKKVSKLNSFYRPFAYTLVGFTMGSVIMTSVHEFGHGSRVLALGGTPLYSSNGFDAETSNIFAYHLLRIPTFYRSGSTSRKGTALSETQFFNGSTGRVFITRGGFNGTMYFSEYLEDWLYFHGGSNFWLPFYMSAKLDIALYGKFIKIEGTGDINRILTDYNERNIQLNKKDLERGNYISLLGSSSFWALFFNHMNGKGRSFNAHSISLGPLKLPDVAYYLNSNGDSYKIKSGFRLGRYSGWQMTIPFAYEFIDNGLEKQNEYQAGLYISTVGFSKSPGMLVGGHVIKGEGPFGDGMSAEAEATFFFRKFNFSFGYSLFDTRTLFGERNASDYLKGKRSHEAWGRVSLQF